MNNYFGIGLDAKITLAFHTKREEHPEQFKNRTGNFFWYGILGGQELLRRSCRHLERKLRLECDGRVVSLPPIQGIVILNIQRYIMA